MTTITQVREGNAKFDIVINDNMPEIFCDGISQMLMGHPITKIILHSVVSPAQSDAEAEVRQGVLRLTIPTPALLEMCRNILSSAQSSLDVLSEGGKQIDAQVRKIMEGVSIAAQSTEDQKRPKKK